MVRVWPAVLDQLMQTAPALAASFDGARPVELDAGERTVTVGFPAAHTFNKRKAEAPDKREQLVAALEAVLGEKLRPVYVVLEDEDAAPEARGCRTTPGITRRWWRRSRASSTLRRSVRWHGAGREALT